jgi:hypothetical protein
MAIEQGGINAASRSAGQGKLRVFISYSRDDLDLLISWTTHFGFRVLRRLSIATPSPAARSGSSALRP